VFILEIVVQFLQLSASVCKLRTILVGLNHVVYEDIEILFQNYVTDNEILI
jgi:hypothetical protein